MSMGHLQSLGLSVSEADGAPEAELALASGQAMNPLTGQRIDRARFAVLAGRLIPIHPPELVGTAPIQMASLSSGAELEREIVARLTQHLRNVERRAAELSAIGLVPGVNPETLQLQLEFSNGELQIFVGLDRAGQLRVTRALRDGAETTVSAFPPFEPAQFADRAVLEAHVFRLFGAEPAKLAPMAMPAQPAAPVALTLDGLARLFGPGAQLPAKTALEVMVPMRVDDEQYRFAAVRVAEEEFRGLLTSNAGKLWSARFSLSDFEGPHALLASILKIDVSRVEVDE